MWLTQIILRFLTRKSIVTPDKIRLRQFILAEFRAGNNIEEAQNNINSKLGYRAVSKWKVKRWYKRFRGDEKCLFKKKTELYGVPTVIQTLPNGKEV